METQEKIRWYRTKVPVVWCSHDIKSLPYKNEPFNDPESLKRWRDLGYSQEKFTGDMYDMRNPEPPWMIKLHASFPWQNWSWSLYRMTPGCVLPNHSDTYAKFKIMHKIKNADSLWRAVIFLEDWQSGHYLEIDGQPVTGWHSGDAVAWRNDTPHLAANVGMTDRYTLQITGAEHED